MSELSIEQQFQLKHFEIKVRKMSEAQAKKVLIELHQSMLVKDAMYKQLIKHQWGL